MIITSPNSWKSWAKTFPQRATAESPYKTPFRILNKGSADTPAEILIYDVIGRDFWSGDGMAAKDFAELLKEIDPKAELTIGINSPGGNVWDGLAIYNMLSARSGNVITRNDGMAASVASVILQAGKERRSNAAAMVMIHKAWGLLVGNSDDAAQFQKELEKHDQVLAEIYSARSGKSTADISAAMGEETFFTGQEAKDFGLVDTVIGVATPVATGSAHSAPVAFNLTANAIKPGIVSDAAGKPQTKENKMSEPTPAPAVNPAPTLDLTPVINAINALGDKLPKAPLPGTEPVTVSRVENLGNPAIEKFQNMEHGFNRANFIRNNYAMLSRDLVKSGIFNANTIDSGLANSLLASDAVQTMRTLTAALAAFTRSTAISPVSKRQVINVPLVSSAASMLTNAADFEVGDTVTTDIAVTVNQYTKAFYVAHATTNLGLMLSQFAPTNALVLAEGIVGLVTALMTNANYGADVVIGAAASFDSADLPAVLALGKNYNRCTLLLDGGHLAYLLPTTREHFAFGEPGAYGFDGGIYKNNLWTGAATDIAGFVCGPDAIVIATGSPANLPNGEFLTQESVTIGAGLTVTASTWFSRQSRAMWGSFDIMFGCAAGDKTQAEVLTTQ